MLRSHLAGNRSVFLGVALLFVSTVCLGQESRGSITGIVMDAQHAVIPGAAVVVTNTATNASNRTTTNQTGYFEANFLDPGTYSVSIEASGFKKLLRSGIILSTGDRLAVDFQLDIGESTTQVEVTADAPLLETTNASSGRVLDSRDVSQLPYTTMNPFSLQAITPGVAFTGTLGISRVMDNAGTASYNTDGLVTSGGNEFLLDGAPVTGTNGGRAGFVPSSEAVGEMRIETAPFDAALGHTIGAYVSATTKSGNNTYHGSVFEQMMQNRWNATPHFTRLSYYSGLAAGTVKPGTPEQPSGKLSQPGFSISGPIRIPKIYNGKNRFFIYFEWDKITQIQPDPGGLTHTVPTAAERAGDYSALLPVNAVAYTVYDPRTAATVAGHVTRTPFPGNIVPSSLITNPAYKYMSQVYPSPNNPVGLVQSDGTNNFYDGSRTYTDYFKSFVNRFDYNLSDRMRLSGKWYYNRRDAVGYDWGHDTPLAGLESIGLLRKNKGGSGDYLYTINANNVLDVGVSLTRYGEGSTKPMMTAITAAQAGLPSYIDQKAGGYDDIPAVFVTGYVTNLGGTLTYPGLGQTGTTETLTGKMSTIHGSHTLKYGTEIRHYYYATVTPGGFPTGVYTFDKTYVQQADNTTTAANLGLGWAAFQMGLPSGISLNTNDTGYYGSRYYALYLQDDFRISSRLRIGFGLRFEREGGTTERFNRGISGGYNSSFVPAYAQAVQAAYAANPIAQLPASQFAVAGGVNYLGKPYGNYTDGTNRFLPNVSMVYQINNKTVLRVGTGWFADTFNALVATGYRPSQNGYSQATTTTVSTDNGLTFCCGTGAAANVGARNPMMDPFPVQANGQRFLFPYGNSLGSDILDGQSFTYYPRDYKTALQQRWRTSVQREITKDMVIDASYNGSYASSPFTRNLSYLPAQYWNFTNTRNAATDSAMTAAVNNPFNVSNFASLAQSNATLYNYLNGVSFFTSKTLQVQQLLRAYPNNAGALSEAGAMRAKNWYHDVELLFQKRFAKGFQSSVMFTRAWSRQQWQPNQFDQALAWQPGSSSRPNRIVWTMVWELPFGRGRQWLTHGPLQHVVGGWQLSWVYQYQTGPLTSWSNLFYYGSLDQVVSALNHDQAHSANIHTWFDPAASYNNVINPSNSATGAIPSGFVGFEGRTAFQPGTYQARMFPQYVDGLRNDSLHNWDTKIFRRFQLYERLNLNFSVDLMNMTNHTAFGGPVVTPTASNFGQMTSQANAPRQIQLNMRIEF